jgi:hypothetical protein
VAAACGAMEVASAFVRDRGGGGIRERERKVRDRASGVCASAGCCKPGGGLVAARSRRFGPQERKREAQRPVAG